MLITSRVIPMQMSSQDLIRSNSKWFGVEESLRNTRRCSCALAPRTRSNKGYSAKCRYWRPQIGRLHAHSKGARRMSAGRIDSGASLCCSKTCFGRSVFEALSSQPSTLRRKYVSLQDTITSMKGSHAALQDLLVNLLRHRPATASLDKNHGNFNSIRWTC